MVGQGLDLWGTRKKQVPQIPSLVLSFWFPYSVTEAASSSPGLLLIRALSDSTHG